MGIDEGIGGFLIAHAEARRLKQAAERKPDGIASKQATLEQSARLFQNALNLPLSLPIQEEALFDLVSPTPL